MQPFPATLLPNVQRSISLLGGKTVQPFGATGDASMPAQKSTRSTAERDAYTLEEFCARHAICRSTYYNLKADGKGPREAHAGRILITREAAEAWRRARELETSSREPTAA